MQRVLVTASTALALGLSACGGGGTAPPESGAFRVVNGITDASTLDANIVNVATASRNIAHDTGSPISQLPVGSYSITFVPNTGREFSVTETETGGDTLTTFVSYGVLADSTQGAFPVTESLDPPVAGQVIVQPVFAGFTEQQSLPSDSFGFNFQSLTRSTESPTGVATAFGDSVPAVSLAADTYRITVLGSPSCVAGPSTCSSNLSTIFDSGPNGVRLPASAAGNIVQVVAVDATSAQISAYGSNLVVLLIDNLGNSTALYDGQN